MKVSLIIERVATTPLGGWEVRRAKNHLYYLQLIFFNINENNKLVILSNILCAYDLTQQYPVSAQSDN